MWTRVRLDSNGNSAVELTDAFPATTAASNCTPSSSSSRDSNAGCALSLAGSASRAVRQCVIASSPQVIDTGGSFSSSSVVGSSIKSSPGKVATGAVSTDNAHQLSSSLNNNTSSFVTLPRRKPYLNLKSVTTGTTPAGSSVINIYDDDSATTLNFSSNKIPSSAISGDCDISVSLYGKNNKREYNSTTDSIIKINGVNVIKRAHSFKDGLNESRDATPTRAYPLSRTQSYHDGLATGYNDHEPTRQSLSRAPSVDEILESVRNLRAKKNMVKSTPDLYQNTEPIYHSASMSRHKSSKSKSSRSSSSSGIIGVRYSKPSDHVYDRVPEPHYEQIANDGDPYYQNITKELHYENLQNNPEVIYDRPRSNKLVENQYDPVHSEIHYENVNNYELPVYENVAENEPTYMNITNTSSNSRSKKSRSSNKEHKSDSLRSNKSSSKKKSSSSSNNSSPDLQEGQTYDIPRSATHIYDTPKKYSRPVESSQDCSEYATPKNNRSVLRQNDSTSPSSEFQRLAKQDQKQKIDDIFADCDRDSLDGDCVTQPDIPPPGEYSSMGYEIFNLLITYASKCSF